MNSSQSENLKILHTEANNAAIRRNQALRLLDTAESEYREAHDAVIVYEAEVERGAKAMARQARREAAIATRFEKGSEANNE
jgi:hypothetical protein